MSDMIIKENGMPPRMIIHCEHTPDGICHGCFMRYYNETELRLRRLLWDAHPCQCKYGDDGELQCATLEHGIIDFKRDSVAVIERKLFVGHLINLKKHEGEIKEILTEAEKPREVKK